MKLEKIKLSELVNEKLTKEEIKLLQGGSYAPGCESGICDTPYCGNTGRCTAGDGVCKDSV